ncbi:Glycoside hydrolase superfamily [Penicillium alfredii]|uniref:Glycoside hydrolase superfamily n=1 Tax=Penicillium alfredii TaxID=1506179 RepID=A0A9W9ERE4_9EURO|nr:Glycoside hydrolase superfamily [Penicillium alfredii]KAJ5086439.1 Glycoside hydrolase superfamily [Penicillium alfredii]
MTSPDGITKPTTWWPLWLFSRFMRDWTVGAHVSCGVCEGETSPVWLRSAKDTPWLNVSATLGDDGYANVAVVNVHDTQDLESRVEGVCGDVAVFTVTAADILATNMEGAEEVRVQESTWDGSGNYAFPKHSLTLLRWKAE